LPPLLFKLLADRGLATEAIRGLALYDHLDTPRLVLEKWGALDPEGRAEAVATLTSRAVYAKELLLAVKSGRVARTDISAFHARQIQSFGDAELTKLLSETWGDVRSTSAEKQSAIARLREDLSSGELSKADLPQGRLVFQKTCATCHVLYGQGKQVGPDLTGGNRKNLAYLLENIVDPSASVAADFRMSVIRLADGRVVNGVVLRRAGQALTVQTQKEEITLAASDVEEMQPTALSLMPDGILEPLTRDQVRDLFSYLMSSEQVALP
jgi:putative heme-binding domain-containing protein